MPYCPNRQYRLPDRAASEGGGHQLNLMDFQIPALQQLLLVVQENRALLPAHVPFRLDNDHKCTDTDALDGCKQRHHHRQIHRFPLCRSHSLARPWLLLPRFDIRFSHQTHFQSGDKLQLDTAESSARHSHQSLLLSTIPVLQEAFHKSPAFLQSAREHFPPTDTFLHDRQRRENNRSLLSDGLKVGSLDFVPVRFAPVYSGDCRAWPA